MTVVLGSGFANPGGWIWGTDMAEVRLPSTPHGAATPQPSRAQTSFVRLMLAAAGLLWATAARCDKYKT